MRSRPKVEFKLKKKKGLVRFACSSKPEWPLMLALLLLEEPEKQSHPKGKARYTLQDTYKD